MRAKIRAKEHTMTTTAEKTKISPLGSTTEEAANRRYERSAEYREQHDRLAPYRAIADAVIIARGAQKFTQRELGKAMGTTDTAVSRIESGRHPISLETLAKLGKALNLSFMVGSAEAAAQVAGNKSCVVVPESAIEVASLREAQAQAPARVARVAPSNGRTMSSYAFGDTAGRPAAARKTR
jgi:transcriptional regulator with XRE-family HTH domain